MAHRPINKIKTLNSNSINNLLLSVNIFVFITYFILKIYIDKKKNTKDIFFDIVFIYKNII